MRSGRRRVEAERLLFEFEQSEASGILRASSVYRARCWATIGNAGAHWSIVPLLQACARPK